MKKNYVLIFLLAALLSCDANEDRTIETTLTEENNQDSPNILLVIADDMGLDATPGYGIGNIKPNMPNLENLMRNGLRFNNVWSNPTCTPTRAGIITGKYGFRTEMTKVGDILSTSETSLHQFLDDKTGKAYSHAVIGKWHLSDNASHPIDMGVNHFTGFLIGRVPSYSNWSIVENNANSTSTEYTTTKFTDLAIDWISEQDKPWFLWLAYNAPHTPFHLPPAHLHHQGALAEDEASIQNNPLPYYMAMIEAMDTELGRLISSMSSEQKDNTIIIFLGDNGSPNQVAQSYKASEAKGTIYQGGVNVPMIISGKNVARMNEIEDALINTTDLFATIADIAKTGTDRINDSRSFKGLLSSSQADKREFVYTEHEKNNGAYEFTIRNQQHKYMYLQGGTEALYKLDDEFIEGENLLNSEGIAIKDTDALIKEDLLAALKQIQED